MLMMIATTGSYARFPCTAVHPSDRAVQAFETVRAEWLQSSLSFSTHMPPSGRRYSQEVKLLISHTSKTPAVRVEVSAETMGVVIYTEQEKTVDGTLVQPCSDGYHHHREG